MQETLHPEEIAAEFGTTCSRCLTLNPSDYFECSQCGTFVCQDCATESELETCVCDGACAAAEINKVARAVDNWRDRYLVAMQVVENQGVVDEHAG